MTKFQMTSQKVIGFFSLLLGVYALAVFFQIVTPLEPWVAVRRGFNLIEIPILEFAFGVIMSYAGYWLLQTD